MTRRATFDADVTAEWQRRCVAFRHSQQWLWWIFWLLVGIAPTPLLLGLVPAIPYALVAPVLLLAVALLLRFRYLANVQCPHCARTPVPQIGRLPLWDIDCCPHCDYWLLNPRHGAMSPNQRLERP
jgi:hypothetical protein